MTGFDNLGRAEYAQLRNAALHSVNKYFATNGRDGYCWLDSECKEDIVSNAVTKALQTYKPELGVPFVCWLKDLAWKAACDEKRRRSHDATEPLYYETEDGDLLDIPQLAKGCSAEDEVIGWETEKAIQKGLEGRSTTDRLIFELDRMGYKPGELAPVFGLTDSAVYGRLHKTKKAVSKELAA